MPVYRVSARGLLDRTLLRQPALLGFALAALCVSLLLAAPFYAADTAQRGKPAGAKQAAPQLSKAFKGRLPITELSEDEAILHALNRLAFGPRPGDVEHIRAVGLEKWIEQQLKPEAIDDSAVEARVSKYPTLAMSTEKLYDNYPNPAQEARRMGMTPEEYRERQQQQRRAEMQEARKKMADAGEDMPAGRQRLGQPGERQLMMMEFMNDNSPRRILGELSAAKLTRAVYSERQLDEVMADFWFNHFNVFAQKGPTLWMLPPYERNVIRPNAMGKFRDLLYATAKSPAMLFYLDNWQSADPQAAEKMQRELSQRRDRFLSLFGMNPRRMASQRGRQGQQRMPQDPNRPGQNGQPGQAPNPQNRLPRGLNENYGRELMELHTLGVDGGYTQQDVTNVARAFTGWTLTAPRRDPEFRFEGRIHDDSAKQILGRSVHAGGMKDGEEVLDMLVAHPSTAKFISTKLARKFVSDAPPPALVERMARSFTESKGDIRNVLRTMIYSPEFWSRDAYRSKIKKPFELVASAARALGADMQLPVGMILWTTRIGEPLYLCQPPTGYSDKNDAWVNTGALLNRINFATELATNKMRGARVDLEKLFGTESMSDPREALDRAVLLFLNGQMSGQTRATLEKQLADPQVLRATLDDPVKAVDAGVIAGLVLGSPEFQRR
jgi:uncharacterized protein (DUF1800 family)